MIIIAIMNSREELHTLEHLVGDHEHGFEGEATAAVVELIFQTSEEVHHHEDVRYFVLVTELGAAGAMLFEFYGNLFASWGRKK